MIILSFILGGILGFILTVIISINKEESIYKFRIRKVLDSIKEHENHEVYYMNTSYLRAILEGKDI